MGSGFLAAGLLLTSAQAGADKAPEPAPHPLDYCLRFEEKVTAQLPEVSPKIFHAALPPGNYWFDFDTGAYALINEGPPKDSDVAISGFYQSGGLLPRTNVTAVNGDIRVAHAAVAFSERSEVDVSSLSYREGLFADPAGFVIVRESGRYFALGEITQSASGISFDYALLRECR